MAKIRQSNLDGSVITGNTTLNETANLSDLVLVYDQSTGTLKQISRKNLVGFSTVSSVSPTSVSSGDGTGNYTFTITGSGFTGSSASLVNSSGTTISFDSVSIDSDTQITGVIAKSSLPGSGEPYDVKVTGSNGLATTLENQINIDQAPAYTTASGSLGSFVEGTSISVSVNATDPESAGNVTFELQSGSLPPGISLTNTGANGGTAILSGTLPTPGSETTYSFVLRAVDAASNVSSRSFSITARPPTRQSFTSSGSFSVPVGVSSMANVLVVGAGGGGGGTNCAGGGGGGGLIFAPNVPVIPGGTITMTVGDGLGEQTTGQNSVFGASPSPGTTAILTSLGGGRGSASGAPGAGGSGGGGKGNNCGGSSVGGPGTQPTQPGQSGAYGFGNPGGDGGPRGAGGGGAGAAGDNSHPTNHGGAGGDGRAYTIADGTTPVGYAGGAPGGGLNAPLGGTTQSPFGAGAGGYTTAGQIGGQPGVANRGGGGGGAGAAGSPSGGSGGKGVIIIEY